MARALWELVSTGRTTLQDGEEVKALEVGSRGWFEIVKWLYSQIDGQPRAEIDLTTAGQPLKAYTILAHPDMWDEDGQ